MGLERTEREDREVRSSKQSTHSADAHRIYGTGSLTNNDIDIHFDIDIDLGTDLVADDNDDDDDNGNHDNHIDADLHFKDPFICRLINFCFIFHYPL